MRNQNRYLVLGCFLIGLDQLVKFLVLKTFPQIASVNSAAAFGIHLKYIDPKVFPIIVTLVAIALGFSLWNREKLRFPIVLFISGALGNLIDRIFRAGVVDFIDLKFWPSFNLADAMLTVGLIWFALELLKIKTLNSN